MTAEIAIMNKSAIALAADSAITLGEQKIYNTINKLFMLSKYHPVGIMVYGNYEFMEIPWETIIKTYRKKLKTKYFTKLKHYGDDFIKFLCKDELLFSLESQKKYFEKIIKSFFYFLKKEIDDHVQNEIDKKNEIPIKTILKIVEDTINNHAKKFIDKKYLFSLDYKYVEKQFTNYFQIVDKLKKEVLQELPISNELLALLKKCCIYLFLRKNSGIVIAGFGEEDIFPSIYSFNVAGLVENKLIYSPLENQSANITYKNTATIIPFAQSEMVSTFMEGIDPVYKILLESYFSKLINEYPTEILKNIKLEDSECKRIEEKLKSTAKDILKNFFKTIEKYQDEYHVDPIISAVASLPKDELAAMAESLVNLTSFKRRVSLDMETVGGPIDVAVITKGDGFVWIKRKHYFRPELNPHFFSNYFKEFVNKKENK